MACSCLHDTGAWHQLKPFGAATTEAIKRNLFVSFSFVFNWICQPLLDGIDFRNIVVTELCMVNGFKG